MLDKSINNQIFSKIGVATKMTFLKKWNFYKETHNSLIQKL